MKEKLIKGKYVFCLESKGGKKQFLHLAKSGIEIRNNIHSNILVIDHEIDSLKQLSAEISFNPKYKDFKKVSLLELTPKYLINESRYSRFRRNIRRICSLRR